VVDGRPVICCYGHGGAGVTLSWGCAADVVGLVPRAG
jgi:D-amino-acid oxidase